MFLQQSVKQMEILSFFYPLKISCASPVYNSLVMRDKNNLRTDGIWDL